MADEMTPEQQLVFDATIAGIQRIAVRILEIPKEEREGAYAITRRAFEQSIQKCGIAGEAADLWLRLTMESLRGLVAEIEARGGGTVGTA
jgi:hypothetical protein